MFCNSCPAAWRLRWNVTGASDVGVEVLHSYNIEVGVNSIREETPQSVRGKSLVLLVALLALAMTATACGATPAGSQGSPPSSSPLVASYSRCTPAGLTARATLYVVAGGQFSQTFVLTNRGHAPCTLEGWPRFEASTPGAKSALTTRVRQNSSSQPAFREVTLKPEGAAAFDVYGGDFNPIANKTCPTISSASVVPPGDHSALYVTSHLPDCGGFWIAPVVAGSQDNRAWSMIVPASKR